MGQNAPTLKTRIVVQCIVTEILMLPAIKQLSSYRSVKKIHIWWILLKIFPKFERTGQKVPRVSIIKPLVRENPANLD